MLTQNGAGDISAAFVNTETLEQCQHKAQMLEGVFTASKIPILERQCVENELQFSAFQHVATTGMSRHFYLLEFNREGVTVNAMVDWHTCKRYLKSGIEGSGGSRSYCASSVQTHRQPSRPWRE